MILLPPLVSQCSHSFCSFLEVGTWASALYCTVPTKWPNMGKEMRENKVQGWFSHHHRFYLCIGGVVLLLELTFCRAGRIEHSTLHKWVSTMSEKRGGRPFDCWCWTGVRWGVSKDSSLKDCCCCSHLVPARERGKRGELLLHCCHSPGPEQGNSKKVCPAGGPLLIL